ncbi:autotransporter domain-containing protein [Marinomonas sp.]|uniref:autotransporter family protein n=1 Tax=Marinomonas sp. TaxID=1904862 RepID=UPI003BAAECB0
MTIAAGAKVTSGNILFIGANENSVGTVTVTGANSSLKSTTNINVGHTGKGTLTIADGAKVTSSAFNIGNNRDSEATVIVKGSGSSLTSTEEMRVGDNGKGTLTISDGATATASATDFLYIARSDGSEGSVIVTGSGSSLKSGLIYVGNHGKGTLTISAGARVEARSYKIGLESDSEGTVTVTGRGSSLTATNDMHIGSGGKGALTISDGAKVTSNDVVAIGGRFGGSEGSVNIGAAEGQTATAAGTLAAEKGIKFGSGTGTLVFNHTNTDYEFTPTITGGASDKSNINIVNGTTRFTGNLSGYTGKTNVKGGTLSIADGGTLALGGDYNQTGGTLKIGASSLNSFGKLKVTKTATFAKNSKINVDVTKANTLAAGSMTKVVEAGKLESEGFVVKDNSALFDFSAVVDGNNVNLTVVQGTDDSSKDDSSKGKSASSDNKVTLLKSVQNQNFTSSLGAASVLDKFVLGGTTGTGMDKVVARLGQIKAGSNANAELSEAVAQTLPLLSGSSSKVSSGVMQANGNVVAARQSSTANVSSAGRSVETGTSSGDGFISDGHAWVKPVGSWAKQDARGGVSGYDAETYGIIGGMDGDINDTTSVGFALSYMNTKADGKGTNSTNNADIDAYQVMFYGQRNLGESFHNLDVTWQAGAGVNQTAGTRNINFMSTTAKSDYTSYTGNLSAGLGRTFAINGDTKLTPSVRADYSYIKDESYKETGADALNLNVRSNTAEAFLISLNGGLDQRINDSLSWAASAGVGYDVMNETSTLTASYTGGGAFFTTEGLKLSPWVVSAGVGVNYALDDATDITVRYDLEGRTDFLSQTATAKFTWVF